MGEFVQNIVQKLVLAGLSGDFTPCIWIRFMPSLNLCLTQNILPITFCVKGGGKSEINT